MLKRIGLIPVVIIAIALFVTGCSGEKQTETKPASTQAQPTQTVENQKSEPEKFDKDKAIELVAKEFYKGDTRDLRVEELKPGAYVVTLSADLGSGNPTTLNAYLVVGGKIEQVMINEQTGEENPDFQRLVDEARGNSSNNDSSSQQNNAGNEVTLTIDKMGSYFGGYTPVLITIINNSEEQANVEPMLFSAQTVNKELISAQKHEDRAFIEGKWYKEMQSSVLLPGGKKSGVVFFPTSDQIEGVVLKVLPN